jgi:cystathionine gamma-synthase
MMRTESAPGPSASELLVQFDACTFQLRDARRTIDNHATYCLRNALPVDQSLITRLLDAVTHAVERLEQERFLLAGSGGTDRPEELSAGEAVVRFGWATNSYVRDALEWCAPATGQAHAVQFFDLCAQNSPQTNYARYETCAVEDLERHIADVLAVPDTHTVSATSSGIAAYTLIEAVLLRHRLRPDDTVLIAPTVHFETVEQLTALPSIHVVRASGHEVADLLADVRQHQPRCVFVDPLANDVRQRLIDVPGLIRRLPEATTEPITVVVDGTMLSNGTPAVAAPTQPTVEVLQYESGSKHLQLGLDLTMAGFVVHPSDTRDEFLRQRRNTGLVLDPRAADRFPRYPRKAHRSRMRRIGANAVLVATRLNDDPRVGEVGQVFHPALPGHPDRALARTLPHADGCLSFLFHQSERNCREELAAVVERILSNARTLGVQLATGTSFGFSVPRLWVARDAGESPFLRLSVGDRADQVDLLVEAVADGVADPIARALAG